MKPRISMITLGVSDLVAATRFYEVGLGLPRLPFEGDAVFLDVSWGGYSGYFADPDGHLWEVAWNPHFWAGPEDE
jgi:catechol 2,3-dioxygenase-like lactoylglutathione lyase family enzyme